jgi:hypothetical protein
MFLLDLKKLLLKMKRKMEIISYFNNFYIYSKGAKGANSALLLYSSACKEKKTYMFFSIIFKKEIKSVAELAPLAPFSILTINQEI